MAELEVESRGQLQIWTLAGEARRNSLRRALVAELEQRIDEVAQARTPRVVVLTGQGEKAFCSGADLKERAGMSENEVRTFLDSLRRTLRAIEKSPAIFIAAVNGLALGGGTELALACDLRVGAAHAELGLTEVKLGIIPGGGGTQRLTRLLGPGRAKELILSGRRIGASEALALGLLNRTVPAGTSVVEAAVDLAEPMLQNAPLALAAAKHAIDEGVGLELEAALAVERRHYEPLLDTQDRLEGLRAFAEKRNPKFEGR